MCDCIEKSELRLRGVFEKEVTTTEYVTVDLNNKSLMLDSGRIQLYGIAEATYKLGKQTRKWKKNILFHFCPLCGVKYNQ